MAGRRRFAAAIAAFRDRVLKPLNDTGASVFGCWASAYPAAAGGRALGFAQRSFLVSLSLFLLAPSTCRPRSLGSISSVIWLKCHRVPRWLMTHLSALH